MKKLRLLGSGRVWLLGLLVMVFAGACSSTAKSNRDANAGDSVARTDGPVDKLDGPGDGSPDARDGGAPVCTTSADGGRAAKTLGEACGCAADCASGFCADGVCCNSTCGESCKTCNLASSLGTCTFVPVGLTDQGSACKKDPVTSCGMDGTCDGKGGCRKYEPGTECHPGKCDSDSVAGGYVCDDKNACVLGPVMSCNPFSCGGDKCLTTCVSNNDCSPGHTCMNGSCGKLALGAVCANNDACASNFCVDGVCCNAACNTPCLSCNQTGYVGHCRLLEAGVPDPDCKATTTASCGTTGLCDPFGSCAKYPQGTVCVTATCAGLTRNTPAVCDGNGTCGGQGVMDCTPYVCTGGACTIACTNDNQCASGHACKLTTTGTMTMGVCEGKLKPGAPCGNNAALCESNFCVDGVCCTSSCTGACRTCNSQGSPGTCTNTASGSADPRGTCHDAGKPSCGLDGLCDGNGSCRKYAAGTQCGDETCTGGVDKALSMCNGSNQCVAGTTLPCSPYACNGTTTCFKSCTNSNQCVSPNTCVNGSCGLKDPGAGCSGDSECKSTHCAQGVCCNAACTGACTACNLAGTEGKCSPVNSGADPHGICKATASTSCGNTGLCNAGACANWNNTTSCKDASCPATGTKQDASKCNGSGQCVAPAPSTCGTFACAGGSCKNTCTANADCVTPNTCDLTTHSCGLKVPGQPCTGNGECGSNFCVDGVCCNNACTGLCQSCSVAGKEGTCSPIATGTDPANECTATNPLTPATGGDCSNNGACNGAGACAAYSTSTSCSTQSCTAGVQHNPRTCSATGTCGAINDKPCTPYVCDANGVSCLTTCQSNTDCATGVTCNQSTHKCGDKLAPGDTCVVNTDCGTGVCSEEKVCCDSACTAAASPCKSCVRGGTSGMCTNIAATGMPRNATACAIDPLNVCGNTGVCDGSGACDKTNAGVSCGAACTADHTGKTPKSCNGTGTCAAGTSTTCNAGYLCDDTMMSCKTSCTLATAATDCAANYSCIGGLCQKKGPGESCGKNGLLCGTGNCVDGVCCNSPSCGPCRSCNTTGNCAPVLAGTADSACNATASTMCGHDGKCDNAGSCTNWSNATSCRAQSCSADKKSQIEAASCTGSGTPCPAGVPTLCAVVSPGYLCVGTACATSCTSSTSCDTGFTCDSTGHCALNPGTGGMGTGGMGTGGMATGGMATGGMATGGMATGGMNAGGDQGGAGP